MTLPAGWTARRPTLDDVPAILTVVHAADTDMYERTVTATGV